MLPWIILGVVFDKLIPRTVVVALAFDVKTHNEIVPPVAAPLVEFVYVTVVVVHAVTVTVPLYPFTEIPATTIFCPIANGANGCAANVNVTDPVVGVADPTAVTANCTPKLGLNTFLNTVVILLS
jgi:hypothetical protein